MNVVHDDNDHDDDDHDDDYDDDDVRSSKKNMLEQLSHVP